MVACCRCNITAELSQAGTIAWFALPPGANTSSFSALSARQLMAANASGDLAAGVAGVVWGSFPAASANSSMQLEIEVHHQGLCVLRLAPRCSSELTCAFRLTCTLDAAPICRSRYLLPYMSQSKRGCRMLHVSEATKAAWHC